MNKFSIKALYIAIIIGFIGILSTYTLSIQVSEQLKTQNILKLKNIAKQISIHFQDAIDRSVNDLQALQAFYSANQQRLSQKEFAGYMKVLNIEKRDHIQALSWVPLVTQKERENFEKNIQKQFSHFTITERTTEGQLVTSTNKPYYTPVTFISPYKVNKAAQGFDLSSNDMRKTSLEHARDSGKMTATAKIRLVQEKENSYGFLIIAPVYQPNLAITNSEERYKALIGYVTGVFRINNLMEYAQIQADKEGLILTLLDIEKNNGGLLYGKKHEQAAFNFNLKIPDRDWALAISLNKALLKSIESPAIVYWVLLLGIVISLLLALCIYALQIAVIRSRYIHQLSQQLKTQNNQLEATVEERTQSLEQKNNLLNSHVDELTVQRSVMSGLMEEFKIAKESAEKRAKDLARSNKDLDDFAYVASHDLKAPLRGIDQLASWVAEDLEEGNLDDVPENLRLMRTRVQRLESLLSDLLAYSRANRQTYIPAQINCNELIKDTFLLISPPENFTLTVIDELPVFSTVGAPFELVIRNLLSNAIKHHHKVDGHIQVSCNESDTYYTFAIKDDGPGIKSNYHQDIFKMFKTLKPRDETEGSGMGLALIKKIVEYYHGRVYVESAVGQGSTFYFTWPKNIIEPDD